MCSISTAIVSPGWAHTARYNRSHMAAISAGVRRFTAAFVVSFVTRGGRRDAASDDENARATASFAV
jgi:hypothetical protein